MLSHFDYYGRSIPDDDPIDDDEDDAKSEDDDDDETPAEAIEKLKDDLARIDRGERI